MSAYVIVDVDVEDPEKFERYRELVPPIVQQYGGRYVVRGGSAEVLEGTWVPKRIVVLEFDNVQRVKEFMESEEYQPVKQVRLEAARTNMIVVEGV